MLNIFNRFLDGLSIMIRPLPLILFGILLLTACTAGVSAEDVLGEKLLQAPTETYDQIVQSYLLENPAPKPGIYTYGETLKVTSFADGTLSVVSVSIQKNTDTNQMTFFSKVLHTLGLHEITDIYTVTRTDYDSQGNIDIKLSLSGWFETGPLLPKKAHFITFKPEHIAEEFEIVTMTGGESPSAKISGTLYLEKEDCITSYELIAAWDGTFQYRDTYSDTVSFSPDTGETEIFWILYEDDSKQISAEMSVWFTFDRKTAPKAHVTDIRGISHQGNYLCTADYRIDEDSENGHTAVIGTITARNVHDSEDVVQYILRAYCTKYGDRDSSTERHIL